MPNEHHARTLCVCVCVCVCVCALACSVCVFICMWVRMRVWVFIGPGVLLCYGMPYSHAGMLSLLWQCWPVSLLEYGLQCSVGKATECAGTGSQGMC